jgi:hypothetical protein
MRARTPKMLAPGKASEAAALEVDEVDAVDGADEVLLEPGEPLESLGWR